MDNLHQKPIEQEFETVMNKFRQGIFKGLKDLGFLFETYEEAMVFAVENCNMMRDNKLKINYIFLRNGEDFLDINTFEDKFGTAFIFWNMYKESGYFDYITG